MRIFALLAVCACSYTRPVDVAGGSGDAGSGSNVVHDGPPKDGTQCNFKKNYTAADLTQQDVATKLAPSETVLWEGKLADGAMYLDLEAGVDPFAGGITVGTALPIEMDISKAYGLNMYVGFASDGNQFNDFYVATGGNIDLTVIPDPADGSGKLMGVMHDLTLVHVTATDGHPATPVLTDCTGSMITSLPFTAPSTPI